MSKIKIQENTKIYVACPGNVATGGPELLHQLGLKAFMFYMGCVCFSSRATET